MYMQRTLHCCRANIYNCQLLGRSYLSITVDHLFGGLKLYCPDSVSHCLSRYLDGKKTSRFLFTLPGVRGIHRNLKQKKIQFSNVLFQKIPFLYFFLHKSLIGTCYGYFHNASKECFWPKKNFKFHAWVQKYHLGNFSIREI